jgi:hypothetical protein
MTGIIETSLLPLGLRNRYDVGSCPFVLDLRRSEVGVAEPAVVGSRWR